MTLLIGRHSFLNKGVLKEDKSMFRLLVCWFAYRSVQSGVPMGIHYVKSSKWNV